MVMMHRSFVSRREELFTEIYFCSVIIDGMNNCLFINGRTNDQSNQSNSKIDKFVRVNFLIFTSNIINRKQFRKRRFQLHQLLFKCEKRIDLFLKKLYTRGQTRRKAANV